MLWDRYSSGNHSILPNIGWLGFDYKCLQTCIGIVDDQIIASPGCGLHEWRIMTIIKYYGSLIWKVGSLMIGLLTWLHRHGLVLLMHFPSSIVSEVSSVVRTERGMNWFLIFAILLMISFAFIGFFHVKAGGTRMRQGFLERINSPVCCFDVVFPLGLLLTMLKKVMNGVSPPKFLHEIGSHSHSFSQGWNGLKDLLKRIEFPVPSSNTSFEKAALKIQSAIRKKKINLMVKLQVNQVKIIPHHFLKHDGTPAVVLQTLFEAKSGVILCGLLCDPANAEPWVNGALEPRYTRHM